MQTSKMVSANERWLADACNFNKTISSPVNMQVWQISLSFFVFPHDLVVCIFPQFFSILDDPGIFTKATKRKNSI
jgi:hypothetical protein